ncbi:hypothetical protein Syn7502_01246 [Synechococcus sp. PCC 7502]|uniref:PFE-CTERM domain-containing protein n=1 Tax=Synechococcus sp. PCC 7502 TaxID=1173263 RepID=UPI00029F81B7|nr:hypothetical protein [Synechococcus sp. PCC 7502]AFY73345.1 hypothetical protein Syn7502_01246 [Synechococcus sp. PCC 7502]
MLKSFLTASALTVGTVFVAAPVHALAFNWSFTPTFGPAGANPYVVKGTISGLVIGSNPGPGITATVTNTPTGLLEGTVFNNFNAGSGFTVDAGGNVTFASAFYSDSGFTNPLFFGGYGGFSAALTSNVPPASWFTISGQTTFTPIAAAVPFEFNPVLGLGVLGGVLVAKKLSGKLIKKK